MDRGTSRVGRYFSLSSERVRPDKCVQLQQGSPGLKHLLHVNNKSRSILSPVNPSIKPHTHAEKILFGQKQQIVESLDRSVGAAPASIVCNAAKCDREANINRLLRRISSINSLALGAGNEKLVLLSTLSVSLSLSQPWSWCVVGQSDVEL